MRYNNYHKHDYYSNVVQLDVVTSLEDYCKRAVELGHNTIFTTNHGTQANIFEAITLGEKYNLKVILGVESYYVEDRFAKDKSNRHIILIALNNDGAKDINRIISCAHEEGFYYKPRIDWELINSINPQNVIVTTACVAGIWNNEDLIQRLHNKFKENLFLEVQNHNMDIQKEVNREVLRLSNKYNIKIIHANDSHYIFPSDKKNTQKVKIKSQEYNVLPADRDLFLKAKGISYEEENDFILDYPDYETIIERYKEQGILNDIQINDAINNTLIFDKAEPLTIINDEIKLPSISKEPIEDLRKIIRNKWIEVRENIDKSKWEKYQNEIAYELDIVEKTNMANYFLIDYYIVKIAQEKYGGVLTKTGRGSAPSFYIVNLLGLTNIDRIDAPVTLFPTRFMSIERILGSRSLPDIDQNTADREPFIKASEDLLGKENCAWLISWKPLQDSSAFRLYCKGIGIPIGDYEEVGKDLASLSQEKKSYTESKYYKDVNWKLIIDESRKFVGVVEGISESPCSMVLSINNVKENLGMIRTKTKLCCLLDGYNCDKYKYLKNDYLAVEVWHLIADVCNMANIPIPTIEELNNLLDNKTFDIYANGLTCTINQADSIWATNLVKKYKPKSVAEMSAFVAVIRPRLCKFFRRFY